MNIIFYNITITIHFCILVAVYILHPLGNFVFVNILILYIVYELFDSNILNILIIN